MKVIYTENFINDVYRSGRLATECFILKIMGHGKKVAKTEGKKRSRSWRKRVRSELFAVARHDCRCLLRVLIRRQLPRRKMLGAEEKGRNLMKLGYFLNITKSYVCRMEQLKFSVARSGKFPLERGKISFLTKQGQRWKVPRWTASAAHPVRDRRGLSVWQLPGRANAREKCNSEN